MATESIKKAIFANIIDNKAIVIAGINERTKLRVLGATMPTSINLTREYESDKTVVLYPNKGEAGLIAIAIYAFDGWTGGKYNSEQSIFLPAFLKVTWESGSDAPRIDLDNPWFPADRIGTIKHQDYVDSLEVAIKERRFSSVNLSRSHRERQAVENTTYDLDGNLLCRYLWGTASEEEVLARIEAPAMLEQGFTELLAENAQILTENNKLRNQHTTVCRAYEVVATENARLHALCSSYEEIAGHLRQNVGDLNHDIGGILTQVEQMDLLFLNLSGKWFKSKAVRKFLEAIPNLSAYRMKKGRLVPSFLRPTTTNA